MAGRTHAHITTAIWDDQAFVVLPGHAQWCYFMLLSQVDLNHAGIVSTTVRRWSSLSGGTTEDDIRASLGVLAATRYVVIDERTEELLVRSLIRRDGVYKMPRLLAIAIDQASRARSPLIREAVAIELARIDTTDLPDKTRYDVENLIKDLPSRLVSAHTDAAAYRVTHGIPDPPADPPTDPPPDGGADGVRVRARVAPSPLPLTPSPLPASAIADSSTAVAADPRQVRDDVERLCNYLAERVEQNGYTRPPINKGWRDAARLMLDRDGRTEEQIRAAITWATDDEFWRLNIRSMSKLRDKYERLRAEAAQRRNGHRGNGHRPTTDEKVAGLLAMQDPEPGDEPDSGLPPNTIQGVVE